MIKIWTLKIVTRILNVSFKTVKTFQEQISPVLLSTINGSSIGAQTRYFISTGFNVKKTTTTTSHLNFVLPQKLAKYILHLKIYVTSNRNYVSQRH